MAFFRTGEFSPAGDLTDDQKKEGKTSLTEQGFDEVIAIIEAVGTMLIRLIHSTFDSVDYAWGLKGSKKKYHKKSGTFWVDATKGEVGAELDVENSYGGPYENAAEGQDFLNTFTVYWDYSVMEAMMLAFAIRIPDPSRKPAQVSLSFDGDVKISGERNIEIAATTKKTVFTPTLKLKAIKQGIKIGTVFAQQGTPFVKNCVQVANMNNADDKKAGKNRKLKTYIDGEDL
ncbi:MAG: hypothetical protein LBV68_06285 [Spirochaetaceae bacterium]|jgi:hypothetical protein|nr:hypothetical protein [Spirochaetaceae bacterium]